jgi:aminoglycoside phosphotransferase
LRVHDFDVVRGSPADAVEVFATGSVQGDRCSPNTAMSTPRRCGRFDGGALG